MSYILVAEDNALQARLVRQCLEDDGHHVRVVHDGDAALAEVRREPPLLTVLDVMMPGQDGLAVARQVRAETDAAVLLLTARSHQDHLVEGFDHGADDYLTKPFAPRELQVRVRALLRRTAPEAVPLTVGDLVLDVVRHRVTVGGAEVVLTLSEFRILQCLAAAPDRPRTRAELLRAAAGPKGDHGDDDGAGARAVDGHIRRLRAKIGETRVETIFGVGYRLLAR